MRSSKLEHMDGIRAAELLTALRDADMDVLRGGTAAEFDLLKRHPTFIEGGREKPVFDAIEDAQDLVNLALS